MVEYSVGCRAFRSKNIWSCLRRPKLALDGSSTASTVIPEPLEQGGGILRRCSRRCRICR
eukprot:15285018-Alexandrium_andersonii.AAC.1